MATKFFVSTNIEVTFVNSWETIMFIINDDNSKNNVVGVVNLG